VRTAALFTSLAALAVACGHSTANGAAPDDGGPCAESDACGDDANADAPPPTSVPIEHVVVVIKENHTFDNYFGTFPGAEGSTQCTTSQGSIPAPHAPDSTPRDLCHSHDCALTDWDGGALDGWLAVSGANAGGDNLFCAQYQESDIPNYWQYARNYGLADHFFANVLGPSFPGHLFFVAAQAGWALDNPGYATSHPFWGCDQDPMYTVPTLQGGTCTTATVLPCFDIPSVPDLLPSTADWKYYGTNFYGLFPEIWSSFDAIQKVRNGPLWNDVVNASTFDSDIDAGTLPAVSWLVDEDLDNEHPGVGSVCQGENWSVGHINKIMQSDYWKNTVVFFTMDDFGGWYDHVPPPRQYGCDAMHPYGLGFRLPLVIISPYAKTGVYKSVAEQASIPKFILKVFGDGSYLGDMDPAAQDKQANDLFDAFDWNQTPLPPLVLAQRTCP